MTSLLLGGSRLQWNDYWFMIDRTFTRNGLVDLGGLFTFQNEHPIVLPQLVYWANAQLTGGSNLALGLVVVAIVAAQIVLLARFVPEPAWKKDAPYALVAAAGALLFARQGLHNFFLAMSGTAWLLANLLVIAAVLVRARHKPLPAVILGVLASMTYGTGLMVWPALIVTGMVVDRRRRPDALVLGTAGIVAIAYFVLRDPLPASSDPRPYQWLVATARVGGSVVTGSLGGSAAIGAIAVVAGGVLSVVAVRAGRLDLAAWVGLYVYALSTCVLIGRSRYLWIVYFGHQSRYASISALLLLSVVGLAAALLDYRVLAVVPIAVVGIAAALHGQAEVDAERADLPAQEELAAAMRLDLADGPQYALWLSYPRVAPLLEHLGQYPFDGTYDGDCGLAGRGLSRAGTVPPEEGRLDDLAILANGRGFRFTGWVPEVEADEPSIDCVVIADPLNRVVGWGPTGAAARTYDDLDPDRSFAAVAPVGATRFRAFAVYDNGIYVRLSGSLRAPTTEPLPPAPDPELPSVRP
jgi:hypothetical protein